MNDYDNKLEKFLIPLIKDIKMPKIFEMGVRDGRSTKKIINICDKNNGKLYSVDIDDCSNISSNKKWKFIHGRDDDFEKIKDIVPQNLDLIFLDTLHEADHVEKIFYMYFNFLKNGGYFVIDDISFLPYLKDKEGNNFYCEINNKETFERVLEIYNCNEKKFDINFSFLSSGLAIIQKKSNENLNLRLPINSRSLSFKNFLRLLWKKIKN